MRLIEHIGSYDVYLSMNTENTDNILRYLKFIMISGDARAQKSRDKVSQKESLQRHTLGITFFYASRNNFSRALALSKYLPICLFEFYS